MAKARQAVNAVAREAWNYEPYIQKARAKDVAQREKRRRASSDSDAVIASLLQDPGTLTQEAQRIMHREWEVAKKAPLAIPPFQGEPHRLEPEPTTPAPTTPGAFKAAPKPPPPSWSASAQRARREAKAAAEGRTIRVYTRTIVQADGNRTREQLTAMETVAMQRHNELMGAIRPPPASKAKTSAPPQAPRPKLTATEKKAATALRTEKAAAKAKANAEYWVKKAAGYQ